MFQRLLIKARLEVESEAKKPISFEMGLNFLSICLCRLPYSCQFFFNPGALAVTAFQEV